MDPGIYRVRQPIKVGPDTAEKPSAPLIIRSKPGGAAILTGAFLYQSRPATDADFTALKARPTARGLTAKVVALPETLSNTVARENPRGSVFAPTTAGLQVFQGERRMVAARWPKSGYALTSGVIFAGDQTKGPIFKIPPEKATQWRHEMDMWVGAFWGHDWHWETNKVRSIDQRAATLEANPLGHPYPMRNDARYFAYNVLSELKWPGEYYVDPDVRKLFYIPIDSKSVSQGVELSELSTLVLIEQANNIVFDGLKFEKVAGDAIVINDSSDIKFEQFAAK